MWMVSTLRNMTSATALSSEARPSTTRPSTSLSVTMPTMRPSSMTGSWLMPFSFIVRTASCTRSPD